MKKTYMLILILALILSLLGCQLPSANVDTSSTLATNLEESLPHQDIITETPQLPLYSVSLPIVSVPTLAEDGNKIFSYNYQNISLIAPDPEIADQIILDFLNRIDSTSQKAAQLASEAAIAYQPGSDWTPYLCSILYTPTRLDSSVFSLSGAYSTYNGAPHPETAYSSITYDMLTGNILKLQDILIDNITSDILTNLIINEFKQVDNMQLYANYENTIVERFEDLEDNGWYLSTKGLCIYFSPYEIAPYTVGKIIVEIAYEDLTGILKNEYFPAEQLKPTGTMSTSVFDVENTSQYSQIAEVILSEDGSKLLLHTDDLVYNVKLETGALVNKQFLREGTVYLSQSLTASDAIMLEFSMADHELIRLTYTGKYGDTAIYISNDSLKTSN